MSGASHTPAISALLWRLFKAVVWGAYKMDVRKIASIAVDGHRKGVSAQLVVRLAQWEGPSVLAFLS